MRIKSIPLRKEIYNNEIIKENLQNLLRFVIATKFNNSHFQILRYLQVDFPFF